MHTKIVFFPVFCIHRQQQKYKSVKLIKVFYGKKHSLSSLVLRKNSRQISSSETTWTSTTSREKVSNEMYVWLTRALKQFSEEVVLAFRTNFDPKYFNVLHVFIAACSSSECFHLFVPFFEEKFEMYFSSNSLILPSWVWKFFCSSFGWWKAKLCGTQRGKNTNK